MFPPRLLVTIDVEEDMPDWRITDPITVHNLEGLARVARLFRELGVRPTYLCGHPVATDPTGSRILRRLHEAGDCEIGTHMHPWNTPPYDGLPGRAVDERTLPYYMYELDRARFRAKLEVLHARVTELTGIEPVSFRAGRFGIDPMTLGEVVAMGYEVDTSVTPLEDHGGDDGGPDFRSAPQIPYRPHAEDVSRRGDLPIVEVPVSVALTHRLPRLVSQAYVYIPRATRLRGLLSRDYLRIIDFAWLYPVRFDVDLMAKAANTLVASGSPVLNVFFHSSELVPGASGRVLTQEDVETFHARLRGVLEHCLGELGAVPATLGEAGRALRPSLGLAAPARV